MKDQVHCRSMSYIDLVSYNFLLADTFLES